MYKHPRPAALFSLALVAIALGAQPSPANARQPAGTVSPANKIADYGNLPLSFAANQGQADPDVRFLTRGSGYSLYLTDSGAALILGQQASSKDSQPDVVRMKLAGANPHASVAGRDQLPGTANYFLGSDTLKWHTQVPTYARVQYTGVYPGVDLVYYGNQTRLEYDFVVAPHADPAPIRLHFAGARRLALTATGDLTIQTKNGEVALHKPEIYQPSSNKRTSISGRFTLLANDTVAFQIGAYDRARPLIIDPVLSYSTYLGGGGALNAGGYGGIDLGLGDQGNHIVVDPTGSAYIVGTTYSTNFPVTAGVFQSANNAPNSGTVFVTKLNATGTAVVYSTYLGGTGGDMGYGIAIDAVGNAYVTGATYSTDFPVTCGAYQTSNPSKTPGATSSFAAKLNTTGSALDYSTYLGGSGNQNKNAAGDVAQSIAVDNSGNAYLTGYTWSSDFPTTPGSFQPAFAGSVGASNAFVTKLNSTGTALTYSTFLGGSGTGSYGDVGNSIAIDSSGNAFVTGGTNSSNFPVTSGAFQATYPGNGSAFVTKLNAGGSAEIYSTYFGGTGGDSAAAIAIDNAGYAYIAGNTNSADLPVTEGVLEGSSYGANAAYLTGFAAKLNPDGAGLAYSTHVQGHPITVSGLAVDSSGSAYLAGTAATALAGSFAGFQSTPDALPAPPSQGYSAFLVKLNPTATAMNYATLFGGSRNDGALAVALDPGGNAYVTGYAGSYDFPVSGNAAQGGSGNGWYGTNAFISKFAVAAEANQTTYPAVPSELSSFLVLNGEFAYLFLECGLAPFDAFYADTTIFTNQAGPGLNGFYYLTTGFGDDGMDFVQGVPPLEIGLSSGAGPGGGYSASYSDAVYDASSVSGGETLAPCAPPPAAPAIRSAISRQVPQGARLTKINVHTASAAETKHGGQAKFTPPPITPAALANLQTSSQASTSPAVSAACLAPPTLLPLTVQTHNASRVYATANPSFSYSIAGLLKGDAVTVTPLTAATQGSPAGSYPINAFLGGADAGKYQVQIDPGALTVLKAPLYISARDLAVPYGQSPPQPTAYLLTGFVNGDTSSVVSGAPVLSTTVTSATPAGFYPIAVRVGSLTAVSYRFDTFSNGEGEVQIAKAPLIVQPANVTIHAGDPMPAFTYSIRGFVNGETQSSATTGSPAITTTAVNTATPGHYYILGNTGTLTAANYYFQRPSLASYGILTILP